MSGSDIIVALSVLAALGWIGLLLVPWQPWQTRETIDPPVVRWGEIPSSPDLSDITVLIPARNEASNIGRTLQALAQRHVHVVVVDDCSTDNTAEIAKAGRANITVVSGKPLPPGWAGKLWGLQQGLDLVTTEFVLLLDADIELAPGMLTSLKSKAVSGKLDLVSAMARLRMDNFWEKLLVPAFVYFFKLLYPFALANDPSSKVAAAAGGCILVRTSALRHIGGFAALRDALIDDCTLAKKLKLAGFKTWIGLSHSVKSHRAYPDLQSLWNMVSRSAFTQLRYSTTLLLLTTFLMVVFFWVPCISAFNSPVGTIALVALMISYLPIVRYYNRSLLWSLLLPVTATLFLLMTWSSAIRYWRGARAEWKDRVYVAAQPSTINHQPSTN